MATKSIKATATFVDKVCACCGETFTPTTRQVRYYCSRTCARRAGWQKRHGWRPKQLVCRVCGDTFTAVKKKQRFYCGNKCSQIAYRNRPRGEEKACVVCGKKFFPTVMKKLCCSAACASRMNARNRVQDKGCKRCGKVTKNEYCCSHCEHLASSGIDVTTMTKPELLKRYVIEAIHDKDTASALRFGHQLTLSDEDSWWIASAREAMTNPEDFDCPQAVVDAAIAILRNKL